MIPLARPNPPRLSQALAYLEEIEASGIFSNFGPVNTRFEQELLDQVFGGVGACVTVCNATLGLMLAMRHATNSQSGHRRFAVMPSFTFAAAAQAAIWCGLTPLFCDIDPGSWAMNAASEEEVINRYSDELAVIVPYSTFGYDIDLARYEALSRRYNLPVVVDAAASLGTVSANGMSFGSRFPGAVVYSMHATKSFATGEGGVIYSADKNLISDLRTMCNFGFGRPRVATMPGLNAKLSEVAALLAFLRLDNYNQIVQTRAGLVEQYRESLPELTFQQATRERQAHQFVTALLPHLVSEHRTVLQERLRAAGIGTASYFSPHLAEQDFFKGRSVCGALPVTEDVAARVISLPLYDNMSSSDVAEVASRVSAELHFLMKDRNRFAVPLHDAPAASVLAWPRSPSIVPAPVVQQPG